MNADDLIESYVTEVAVRLPRKQRNDVAFELRALLKEGLQAKAEAAGRKIDEVTTTEFLQAFGHPVEVAARYRPALTIIDPADGQSFLRASVIGLAIIWGLGLLRLLQQPMDSASDLLMALGRWWGATVIPSLSWPGMLVVGFGLASWARRRWPQHSEWKPPTGDRMSGGRVASVMGLVGILLGLSVLLDPGWFLFGGRASPAAQEAFTYTETFRQRQGPWLLALILLYIPVMIAVIVNGRHSALVRRVEVGLSLATCALLAWTALDGPVFMAPDSDRAAKGFLLLIAVFALLDIGIKLRRSVRPTPH